MTTSRMLILSVSNDGQRENHGPVSAILGFAECNEGCIIATKPKSPEELSVSLQSGREAIVKLVEGADGAKKYKFDRFNN